METQRSFGMIAADVRAAQGGNAGAMNRILTDVQDMVYYNCLRILRNEQNALDASQEILITVYRKLGSLSDPTAYIGWVKRITANHCKNRLCKVNKEFLLSVNEEGEDPFAAFEDTDEQRIPEKVIDNAETRRMIVELIDRLPDEQRMCVMLYYYDEMKTREIAETLGVSEGTVKSRLNYARKSIKEGVQAYEKQGIKLYGLSPILFLTYFLRASGKTVSAPFAIQMSVPGTAGMAAGTGAAAHAAAEAAGSASAAAKATGFASFLSGTAGKVVAGIVAALVLGGAAAGVAAAVSKSPESVPNGSAPYAQAQAQSDDPYAGLFAASRPEADSTVESTERSEPTEVPDASVPVPEDVWVEQLCTYENDVYSGETRADAMFACDLDGDGTEEPISYSIRFDEDDWSIEPTITVTAGAYRYSLSDWMIYGVSSAMVVDLDPNSPFCNLILNIAGELYDDGFALVLHPEGDRLVCDAVLDNQIFWQNGKIWHEPFFSDRLRSHDAGWRCLSGDALMPDSDWYTWNDAYVGYFRERYRAAGGYFTLCELHVIRDLPCTIDGESAVIPAGSTVSIYGDHATEPLVAVKTADGRIAIIRVERTPDDQDIWIPYCINGVPQDSYFEEDRENGNYWE